MVTLSKYLLGLAALSSVIFLSYEGLSSLSYEASIDTTPEAGTPQWKIARLTADPATPMIPAGSLSPIYPATPGKELLGKPIITAVRVPRNHQKPVIGKQPVIGKPIDKPVRQALRMNRLPRQIYAAGEQDRYSQQRLGYAFEPQSQPRVSVNFGHGIY